jgi:hypothetical protein
VVDAETAEKLPAAQFMHEDAPEFAWYWPAAQLEQAVDAPVAA